ncbi:MAG TPA: DUF5331 domain-containing protein [Nostocaceae cyanobacterium]|nr:DUF5331 domain-containing protein [Nostocaceae cyanobacterium]
MMDIQKLRQSLKMKWLSYYEQNRHWLVKLKIWRSYDGLRRPSSGYILATLSILEPNFEEVLAFILDLNSNPDQIVAALGLHFDPDQELRLAKIRDVKPKQQTEQPVSAVMSPTTRNHPPVLFKVAMKGEQKRQPVAVVAVNSQRNQPLQEQKLRPSPTAGVSPSPTVGVSSSLSLSPNSPTLPFPTNGKSTNLPQPNISNQKIVLHYTNARSFQSWLDEFCPGVGID